MRYLIVTYNNHTKEYHNYIEHNFDIGEDGWDKELYSDEIIINIIKL